jgi:hypothetical protein
VDLFVVDAFKAARAALDRALDRVLGMFWSIALSIASRSRGLADESPPPSRAAAVISRMSRVKTLPRFASAAACA